MGAWPRRQRGCELSASLPKATSRTHLPATTSVLLRRWEHQISTSSSQTFSQEPGLLRSITAGGRAAQLRPLRPSTCSQWRGGEWGSLCFSAAGPLGSGSVVVALSPAEPCCSCLFSLNQMRAAPTGAVKRCAHVRDAAAGTAVPANDRGPGHQPAPRRWQSACDFDAPPFPPITSPIAPRASGGISLHRFGLRVCL